MVIFSLEQGRISAQSNILHIAYCVKLSEFTVFEGVALVIGTEVRKISHLYLERAVRLDELMRELGCALP